MNTYVILACVLAVVGSSHASAVGGWGLGGYGLGGYGLGHGAYPIYAPAAVSTANLVKAAPIPVVKSVVVPVPISYGWSGLGGYGGYGWGNGGYGWGLGGKGLGSWGYPWGGYSGYGGYGLWNSWGKH